MLSLLSDDLDENSPPKSDVNLFRVSSPMADTSTDTAKNGIREGEPGWVVNFDPDFATYFGICIRLSVF